MITHVRYIAKHFDRFWLEEVPEVWILYSGRRVIKICHTLVEMLDNCQEEGENEKNTPTKFTHDTNNDGGLHDLMNPRVRTRDGSRTGTGVDDGTVTATDRNGAEQEYRTVSVEHQFSRKRTSIQVPENRYKSGMEW